MDESAVDLDMDALWQQAMAQKEVVAATHQRAVDIATRARTLAAADGVYDLDVRVERYYLPNGRTSYNVVSDEEYEYGTESKKRLRALRRAAREAKK